MTSYCTYAEILARSGTTLPQATIEALIVDADKEINAALKSRGLSPDYTNEGLQAAGVELTLVRLFVRRRLDGTMPSSVSTGSFSRSDSIDKAIEGHQSKAAAAIADYIASMQGDGSSLETDRVDAEMEEFHLDQMPITRYGEDR